jgi:hypothetical protein
LDIIGPHADRPAIAVLEPLLETAADIPHYVAILPAELAGEATDLEDLAPRLGGELIVEVEDRSAASSGSSRAPREDSSPASASDTGRVAQGARADRERTRHPRGARTLGW